MCGLLFSNIPSIAPQEFEEALSLLRHRGPDGNGVRIYGDSLMGHCRLQILDLNVRSNQPFLSRDGKYSIVYNGEIYNYRELARRYRLQLRTECDTEVLLELYILLGHRVLEVVEGMFAFVILDTDNNEFFAARDRLGVKPLYWSQNKEGFIISSELRPILELIGGSDHDITGLRQYLKLRTFFNNKTAYKDIAMFPAGHYYHRGRLASYWSLQKPFTFNSQPNEEELRSLIDKSIIDRTIADVAFGTYLSGGLDSTIVTSVARPKDTWTTGLATSNEFAWGRIAANYFHTEQHEISVTPNEFMDTHKYMVESRREPLSVPNEVLIYIMTKAAKPLNTVILSGEGADELFFGYDRMFNWASQAKRFEISDFTRLYEYGSHTDSEIVCQVLEPFMGLKDPLAIVASFFQTAHLHGLLRRLDNSTMLASVEARVPFVDSHHLVEKINSYPYIARTSNDIPKMLLKKLYTDRIPVEIVNRPKIGFPVPLGKIYDSEESPSTETPMDVWLSTNLEILGLDKDSIRDIKQEAS